MDSPTALETKQAIEKALAKIGDIATLPEVTLKIIKVVEDPNSTARDLHAIIKNDPALSAKILKVVNSAFYGLPGQISSVDRAIVLLGLRAVKNIAIAASVTRLFKSIPSIKGFNPRDLWKHSLAVAVAARLICRFRDKAHAEEAFLAGLIHDLGVIVALQAFSDRFNEVVQKAAAGKIWCEAEIEVFGVDHQALGLALAAKWKFPLSLRAPIGYHHCPERVSEEHRWLTYVVHVADLIACQDGYGFAPSPYETLEDALTQDALAVIGLAPNQVQDVRAELEDALLEAEASIIG